MKIAVTAATGQLGRLVVQNLLKRGVAASDIVATVRDPAKAEPLAAQGIDVRRADYNDPEAFVKALSGVERLLLISGLEANRAEQHRNIVRAARDAGVGFIAYTSILNADRSSLLLARDHRVSEEAVRDSGVAFALLRNSWYLENYTGTLEETLERGVVIGSAGEGRVSAATRADYAEAAAAVLVSESREKDVYELGGDSGFTLPEFAAELTRQSGREVHYQDMSVQDYTRTLVEAGVPEGYAALLADGDRGLAAGELFTESRDLHELLGRSPTTLAQVIASSLKNL